MQVDVKVLPFFEFNKNSEQAQLVASINNANIMGGGPQQQSKKVDFKLIEQLLSTSFPASSQPAPSVSSESAFQSLYDSEIKSQRQAQEAETKEMLKRKQEAQQVINDKIQKEKENEDAKMNEEFERILDEEEKKKAEEEYKKQQEQQKKDDMCFKLASELLDGDYDTAKMYLSQSDWDYSKVENQIKKQKEDQLKLEEERNQKIVKVMQLCHWETDFEKIRRQLIDCNWNADGLIDQIKTEKEQKDKKEQEEQDKIFQVIQQCEDLNDFEQIRAMLVANNWNVKAVVDQEKFKNQLQILMVNCSKQQEKILLTFQRGGQAYGTTIIEQLLQIKPLSGGGDSQAYNIYRDAGKTKCINYIMLSNTIDNLGLDQQPNAPSGPGQIGTTKILYFNQDMSMKFD